MATHVATDIPASAGSSAHAHAHEHQPIGGRILTLPFLVCALLIAIGVTFIVERYQGGLGAVANINDGYPWGIWVAIDIVIGTAFGCAGYVMALLVYILNKGEYHPMVRSAVLASLFGYGLAGLAVLIDLGRYWQFYNMILPWYAQPNSVMLEVGLCVAAYTTVLMIEFAPAFLEKFGMENARRKLNKVLFLFIALGVLLPTMHQSSLGTMMVIVGHKLSPIWQTQMLPVFFLTTAVLMGFAIVVWESLLSSAGLNRPYETPLLTKLAGIMAGVAIFFVVLRLLDLVIRGQLGTALGGPMSGWFWAEMLLIGGGLVLLLPKANRQRKRTLFISSSMLLVGGILYRLNVYLIGFTAAVGPWHYFPSFKEIMITVGIFALEVALYLVFVKKLPVMHAAEAHKHG